MHFLIYKINSNTLALHFNKELLFSLSIMMIAPNILWPKQYIPANCKNNNQGLMGPFYGKLIH